MPNKCELSYALRTHIADQEKQNTLVVVAVFLFDFNQALARVEISRSFFFFISLCTYTYGTNSLRGSFPFVHIVRQVRRARMHAYECFERMDAENESFLMFVIFFLCSTFPFQDFGISKIATTTTPQTEEKK